jgi:hypothetical protein
MTDFLVDVDPGDENVQHPESTGLCARPWCSDAALPEMDYCANCEGDVENLRLEAIREHQLDDLIREVKNREQWAQAMARLFDQDAA